MFLRMTFRMKGDLFKKKKKKDSGRTGKKDYKQG